MNLNLKMRNHVDNLDKHKYLASLDNKETCRTKIYAKKLRVEKDEDGKNIIAIKGIIVVCKAEGGGSIMYRSDISCTNESDFCAQLCVNHITCKEEWDFEEAEGVECTMRITEHEPDKRNQTIQNINTLIENKNFMHTNGCTVSQFSEEDTKNIRRGTCVLSFCISSYSCISSIIEKKDPDAVHSNESHFNFCQTVKNSKILQNVDKICLWKIKRRRDKYAHAPSIYQVLNFKNMEHKCVKILDMVKKIANLYHADVDSEIAGLNRILTECIIQ